MTKDLKITFPEMHYVGLRKEEDGVLGFMTPDGTDAAAEKRKGTVDAWARKGSRYAYKDLPKKDQLDPLLLKNEPLEGLSLGQTVQHGYGWTQGDVKWRVSDPRGFQLEISAPNLTKLIQYNGIDAGGMIRGKCMWARSGSENILVPLDSDVYRDAMANTERKSKSASLKDLRPGDHVVMHNGFEGRYLGVFYETDCSYPGGSSYYMYAHQWTVKKNKKHFFIRSDNIINTVGSPKLSEIEKGEPISVDEALDLIFKHGDPAVASPKDQWGVELRPALFEEVSAAMKSDGRSFVVEIAGEHLYGSVYDIDKNHWRRQNHYHTKSDKIPDEHYRFQNIILYDLISTQTLRYEVHSFSPVPNQWNGFGYSSRPPIRHADIVPRPDMQFFVAQRYFVNGSTGTRRVKELRV